MRALLLSAYAAQSHLHWQQSLLQILDEWDWRVLSLPARHFSWRIRGNPLYWSLQERETLEQDYDCITATSMVDLATLRGLVPAVARIPTVLYFHENQFVYPQDRQQHNLIEAQILSIYSALAADRIVFNSHYNHDTFMSGCSAFLAKMPDRVPRGIVELLQNKASVLPVPYDSGRLHGNEPRWPGVPGHVSARPLRLCWVGRFEHDKGPEGLMRILHCLEHDGLDFELAIIGQQFRNSPAAFADIRDSFGHRIVQYGYLQAAADYWALLQAADIVISTAIHEFQGLAVMQAVACGCVPVVPNRLAYPENYERQYCYDSSPENPRLEAESAALLIENLAQLLRAGSVQAPDVSRFTASSLTPHYRRFFAEVAGSAG